MHRNGDRASTRHVMNILYLRLQGMLAHAPTGWLHPVPRRDTVFLSLYPWLTTSRNSPVSACANYTCANQPTSNEARPVALSAERVEPNHSRPPRPEAGWSVDLLSVSTTSLTLLNYAEALTNFRPPMLYNPLLVQERESSLIGSCVPLTPIPPKKRLS